MSGEEDKRAQAAGEGGMTRRQWLLRLGEATVLVGFSGLLAELPAEGRAVPAGPGAAALPPGLYLPSPEHLGHSMATIGTRRPPPGCETDFAPAVVERFTPAFFTAEEWEAVRALVRGMLGEVQVETTEAALPQPSAAIVARIYDEVAQWIDRDTAAASARRAAALALDPAHREVTIAYAGEAAWLELLDDPQPDWREGLAWLETESRRRFHRGFAQLEEARQLEILRVIAEEPAKGTPPGPGQRLFTRLKAGVIRGFYTSQTGLYELGYRGNSYYTESPGCEGNSGAGN